MHVRGALRRLKNVNWIVYLIAAAAGASNPVQAGVNAELKKQIGHAVTTMVFVYVTGLLGSVLIYLFSRQTIPSAAKLAGVPWWAWTGGLVSIGATLAGATLAQRMGSGVFTGLTITASLLTSLVLDNYGWVGFKVHPASWPRMLGCGLMLAGLWLMSKF